MKKIFKILLLMCVLFIHVGAQNVSNSVPVKWQRYKVEEKNVSALFPKLPVMLPDFSKVCYGEETAQYIAYADESIFTLRVSFKVKPYEYCPERRKFSEKNFAERLKEIASSEEKEVPVAAGEKATAKFVRKYWTRLLFNDSKNDRWFELYAVSRDLSKPAVNNFLESLKIGRQIEGIEIGNGAPANYGDAPAASEQNQAAKTNSKIIKGTITGEGNGDGIGSGSGGGSMTGNVNAGSEQNKNIISDPIIIVFKPRANYTDAARTNDVQGTVRLRVTFYANGGIGSITPINSLTHGLTEQAIAAARKLFFLPARRNNVEISITKIVEYQFALY